MSTRQLFEKNTLAGIELKNRLIRSATHEGMSDAHGKPLESIVDLYLKLANGGVGMIITGFVGVKKNGRSSSTMKVLDGDDQIETYQKLMTPVRELGTPIILQIAHAGGLASPSLEGNRQVAPSRMHYKMNRSTATELTSSEIEDIIDAFVSCIVRAKKVGFDGVQLHAAHGYLLSEFLSPYLNKRKDKWGASTEKRFSIIREIFSRSRDLVGSFPIFAKISGHDDQKEGMTPDEAVRIACLFEKASCDAIEVSCGNGNFLDTVRAKQIPFDAMFHFTPGLHNVRGLKRNITSFLIKKSFKLHTERENYNVAAADKIKKSVSIPVIVVGGIRKLESAQWIIESGASDYVSLCRPLIIDPNLPEKWKSGKQLISQCIDCNYCLMGCLNEPLKCYFGKLPNMTN